MRCCVLTFCFVTTFCADDIYIGCADGQAAQADLRLCCSHMSKTGFPVTWLKSYGTTSCTFLKTSF